jgi:hypothetical protein
VTAAHVNENLESELKLGKAASKSDPLHIRRTLLWISSALFQDHHHCTLVSPVIHPLFISVQLAIKFEGIMAEIPCFVCSIILISEKHSDLIQKLKLEKVRIYEERTSTLQVRQPGPCTAVNSQPAGVHCIYGTPIYVFRKVDRKTPSFDLFIDMYADF